MSEDLTGRRIGHYKIDAVLGRGGMSVMYKATDVRLGRKVALKVMGENLTGDAEFRERFVDEARNTSAIDHPNVVPLYDFGEVDGLLYIAMRLVDGADLASLIKDGPLQPERAFALLGQVAEALDMLHDRGLVHLDVKPANVLVTNKESAAEHVYLADFGLTRRGVTGHRTRSGDFLGSPTYAAPEHLRGLPVDGRTDEYALACVLFACLTGRPPFQGQVPEVISGHLNSEAPAVSSLTGLPAAIDEVVRKGMAKEPAGRYPDCRDLIAAARTALATAAASGAGAVLTGPASGPNPAQPPQQPPQPQQPQQPQPPMGYPSQFGQQQSYPQQPQPQPMPHLPQPQPQMPPQPQPPMGQPGMPPQGMGYPQQQYPYPQGQPGEPMRLRPPAPVGNGAFSQNRGWLSRWGLPLLVGAAAIVVIIVLVIVFSSGGNSGGGGTGGGGSTTTIPSVQVGPSGSDSQGQLPTNFPT